MANSYNFRTMFNDNFKVLTWLLILFIAITPNFIFIQSARASTLGGWTITQQIAQGASLALTATKTTIINGANVVKTSTAKIKPTVGAVSKVLARGAAGYALSIAVEQLIGSVDWVLDPANNQIKYYPPGNFVYYTTYAGMNPAVQYSTLTQLCAAALAAAKTKWPGAQTYGIKNNQCYVYYGSQTAYDHVPTFSTQVQSEERTLPLNVVASQVISNAESETDEQKKAGAQEATTAAAQDMLANDSATQSDVETQLNTNAKTQTSEEAAAEATPKDPAVPEAGTDIKITFPVFCSWAPTVCEAANVVINFPTTLTNWWNTSTQAISTSYAEAKQFFTEEFYPDTDNSEVTVEQDNNIIFDDSQRINFSDSCPAPEQFTVSFFGYSQNLEFSYQPLCEFMSMIKFFVIAGSYVIGAYIVMGLSRGSAE